MSSLDLSSLTSRKAAISQDVSLAYVLRAPHFYVRQVSGSGTGKVRLLVFGDIIALDDPDARTFDPRQK